MAMEGPSWPASGARQGSCILTARIGEAHRAPGLRSGTHEVAVPRACKISELELAGLNLSVCACHLRPG